MINNLSASNIRGLPDYEMSVLQKLIDIFNYHSAKNNLKLRYYEGKIKLSEVNLGIAIPGGIGRLEVGCSWGSKCVDLLAARSMFDGFVGSSGADATEMKSIADDNHLISQYQKACKDELKFGCTFATLSADKNIGCRIRFHSPNTAAAIWDGEKGRIGAGMAIIDTVQDEYDKNTWSPSCINLYTDNAVWVLRKYGYWWEATEYKNKMGIPLMVPMVWNDTSQKPFGRSRLKMPIRMMMQQYVRTMANMAIALEFETTPQKYILGVTDEQYDAIISNKFKQYIGNILAATTNPETGANPVFGQLAQGNLEPHIAELRALATQFCAATGLSVVDIGVVNDANPTSYDAILAQQQTLVLLAEQLNTSNGEALRQIALMSQAIANNAAIDELDEDSRNVIPHFKNPAMPSVSVTADAAIKISSARPNFANTDTFLEMIGFDQADIRRIKAQEQRSRGAAILEKEFSNNGNTENNIKPMGTVQGQAEQNQ